MCVFECGFHRGVACYLLDFSDRYAGVEKVGDEGVPEGMQGIIAADALPFQEIPERPPYAVVSHEGLLPSAEEVFSSGDAAGPVFSEDGLKDAVERRMDVDNAVPVALPSYAEYSFSEIDVGGFQADQFVAPHAGEEVCVYQLREIAAAGDMPGRSGKYLFQFFGGEASGQALRQVGKALYFSRRVFSHDAEADEVIEHDAQRGQLFVDGGFRDGFPAVRYVFIYISGGNAGRRGFAEVLQHRPYFIWIGFAGAGTADGSHMPAVYFFEAVPGGLDKGVGRYPVVREPGRIVASDVFAVQKVGYLVFGERVFCGVDLKLFDLLQREEGNGLFPEVLELSDASAVGKVYPVVRLPAVLFVGVEGGH